MLREIKTKTEHYFEDGHGFKQGEFRDWYNNGQSWEYSFYLDGQLHGERKIWHHNGQISVNCFYVNGIRHGEYKRCSKDGGLLDHCFYVNGEYISFVELPYPETKEDRMYFTLKYNLPLLPLENSC